MRTVLSKNHETCHYKYKIYFNHRGYAENYTVIWSVVLLICTTDPEATGMKIDNINYLLLMACTNEITDRYSFLDLKKFKTCIFNTPMFQ